ncbi:hypothetical protein NST07_07685 [Paenibacillus sp. FSL L8-0340]|uniref:hypothetical protein n=1 Tax=Paenibacillus sp. FSL L8-0340 TaxID=2954685 RepID=UPI003158A147
MTRRYSGWMFGTFLLIILLSGCRAGVQSETVIIPDNEETDHAPQSSSSFQVKAIYRLPDEYMNEGYWLGWDSADSIVGLFKTSGIPEQFNLKRLTYPYEHSGNIKEIRSNSQMELSPDGKYAAQTTASNTGLKMVSLKDEKETEIKTLSIGDQEYVQDISWSGNSQYLSYLVLNASEGEKSSVHIYDMQTHASKKYEFKDFEKGDTLLSINVSDDGRSALFTLFESNRPGKTVIKFGRVTGSNIEIIYKHEIGREQNTWISNDQFAFLGPDGTLYEYDQRNSELSVILENVSAFKFSDNRKIIAYSLKGEDAVYVGKMQGRNVLYREPVYHGIVPLDTYWNMDNTKLLIQGSNAFVNSHAVQTDFTRGPSFIIELE